MGSTTLLTRQEEVQLGAIMHLGKTVRAAEVSSGMWTLTLAPCPLGALMLYPLIYPSDFFLSFIATNYRRLAPNTIVCDVFA